MACASMNLSVAEKSVATRQIHDITHPKCVVMSVNTIREHTSIS
jgi:hypothetical protein